MLAEGQSLRAMMTTENRLQFEAARGRPRAAGRALDRMEPWLASLTLSLLPLLRQGYQTESGVERRYARAPATSSAARSRRSRSRSTCSTGCRCDAQLTFLDKTVEAMPEADSTLDAMVANG
jgi:hypothetical protein